MEPELLAVGSLPHGLVFSGLVLRESSPRATVSVCRSQQLIYIEQNN